MTSGILLMMLVGTSVSTAPVISVPSYRSPSSCARNACLPLADYCSEEVEGVYKFLGPACATGETCTVCLRNSTTGVLSCKCEQLPYIVPALYGGNCSALHECGSGSCFRPCSSFLYLSYCPSDRCVWDYEGRACRDLVYRPSPVFWSTLAPFGALSPSERLRGELIVNGTGEVYFPMSFSSLKTASAGYYIQGEIRLSALVSLEIFFLMLDVNSDRWITQEEFQTLPEVLSSLGVGGSVGTGGGYSFSERRLTAASPGESCRLSFGGFFFCPGSGSCVSSCWESCGWQNTGDPESGLCVSASVEICSKRAEFFCAPELVCVPACSSCSYSVPDQVSRKCLQAWWGLNVPSADEATWICRDRKSAGQSCISDMDCVFGKKVCENGVCGAIAEGGVCSSDRDCGPIGFFCDNSVCSVQRTEHMPCTYDGQCGPFLRCSSGQCLALFSLPIGAIAADASLCQTAVITADSVCSAPFSSKRLSQGCLEDRDCPTTDASGSLGSCACTSWWDDGDLSCKSCRSVSGDLANHGESIRNYLFLKGTYCGSIWTDEECVLEAKEVKIAFLTFKCEMERLDKAGGTMDPNAGCGYAGTTTDYCTQLEYAVLR